MNLPALIWTHFYHLSIAANRFLTQYMHFFFQLLFQFPISPCFICLCLLKCLWHKLRQTFSKDGISPFNLSTFAKLPWRLQNTTDFFFFLLNESLTTKVLLNLKHTVLIYSHVYEENVYLSIIVDYSSCCHTSWWMWADCEHEQLIILYDSLS